MTRKNAPPGGRDDMDGGQAPLDGATRRSPRFSSANTSHSPMTPGPSGYDIYPTSEPSPLPPVPRIALGALISRPKAPSARSQYGKTPRERYHPYLTAGPNHGGYSEVAQAEFLVSWDEKDTPLDFWGDMSGSAPGGSSGETLPIGQWMEPQFPPGSAAAQPVMYPPPPGPPPGYMGVVPSIPIQGPVCPGHEAADAETVADGGTNSESNACPICNNPSPHQWRFGSITQRMVCSACGLYETRTGKQRPPQLEVKKWKRRMGGGKR